jgi:hypothetical protein
MIAGAFLGLFYVPMFFVLIQRIFGRRARVKQVRE